MTRRKLVLAAAGAVVIFAAAMISQIVRRSALTMDEIHTLLLGTSWMQGDVLPFYVGSVTRYEGGSWLIAWPVSWLLGMGASGTAATSSSSRKGGSAKTCPERKGQRSHDTIPAAVASWRQSHHGGYVMVLYLPRRLRFKRRPHQVSRLQIQVPSQLCRIAYEARRRQRVAV